MHGMETTFQRTWLGDVSAGFVSYGSGADIDAAFDDAALSDRFDFGSSGLVPSVNDVDPAGERVVHDSVLHRHQAWRRAIAEMRSAHPGVLYAIPVAPLKAFRHRNVNVIVTDPVVDGPSQPEGLWRYPELVDAASGLVELPDGEVVVSGSVVRKPSVRYKATSVVPAGAREPRFAVYLQGHAEPLSMHDTAAAAKKAAMLLARDKSAGMLQLEIRQVIGRQGGEPLIAVSRQAVACKRFVRLLVASPKSSDKPLPVDGWLFYGVR